MLDDIAAEYEWEWRVGWYRGLLWMSANEPRSRARRVRIPVSQTFRVSSRRSSRVGCAAESSGKIELAARLLRHRVAHRPQLHQRRVRLARCRLALGDHDGSVAAYDRVPNTSNAHELARIAKAQGLLHDAKTVAISDVVAAGAIVGRLPVDGEARARLTAEVLEAALSLVKAQGGAAHDATVVLGCPLTEEGVRRGLEDIYRGWRIGPPPGPQRIELVDRANRVRPRTLV